MRNVLVVSCAFALAVAAQSRPCLAADEPAPPAGESELPSPHRFAVTPSWTHAFVPRSVSTEAIGLTLQTFFGATSRFGVGVTGALYSPFSETRAPVPASFPATETFGTVLTEFSWVAIRGHRAELSLVAGVGVIASRPLSVVDPSHRTFTYDNQIAFAGGAVARVYLTRDMALSLDARDVTYAQQLENADVSARTPEDSWSWYGARRVTMALETRVGLTVFLAAREP